MGNLFEDNSLFTPSIEKQGKSSANLSDIKNNVFDSKKNLRIKNTVLCIYLTQRMYRI